MTKPKKLKINTLIEVYEDPANLIKQDFNLLVAAKEALVKSYAPYSGFQVAAAAILEDGTVISGANQENAAYPMCLCAEQVCLAAVRSVQPQGKIVAMAITVHNAQNPATQPAAPCGACRQVLSETEDRQQSPVKIIFAGESGEVYVVASAKSLLPLSFNQSFL
ncbi:MAG: cytidine deaminase [Saprospiraceae bacterium]|nr:MAG: cytidine deaminase [Saprospiraceae bacterium]